MQKSFEEVVNFSKQLNKLIVLTRGEKGAIAINGGEGCRMWRTKKPQN